jgi:hypothetical protein
MGWTGLWSSAVRPIGRDVRPVADRPAAVPDGPAAMPGAPPAASPEPSAGGHRRGLALLGVTAVYAAIAVAAYLPTLPLDGSHTQICTCVDTAQEVWFLGWVPFALAHGHSLFYTNWILYPAGVNLTDNTAMTLLGLIAAPVTVLAGPIAAYNLVLRAGFALSALAMFVTVRRLVRWWPAAFFAGLLYGFSPFMAGQGLSHEFLVFAPVPPLVFGILADVFSRRRMSPRRAGLLLGLLAAAQFLIAAETFVMMLLFAALGSVLALCYRRGRDRLGHLAGTAAWALGTCAVIVAYPVYFFFAGTRHIVGSPHPQAEIYRWHGDALGALLPAPLMRFAPAAWLHQGALLVGHNLQENGTYLGAPLVAAAFCCAVACRRRPVTVISMVLAVVSYALSLGRRIYAGNRPTGVPGPFALLAHARVLQDVEPARFSLFTALFVAVVLGTGLSALRFPRPAATASQAPSTASQAPSATAEAPSAAAGRSRAAIAAAVGLVALLPLVPRWPYPAGPVVTPRLFTTPAVARLPRGAVAVTLPFPVRRNNEALVWQAAASMRFRLAGGSPFFMPGAGQRSFDSRLYQLAPLGIQRVFTTALSPPPGLRGAGISPGEVSSIRHDFRRYHVSAVLIDPVAQYPVHGHGLGMPPAWRLREVPGLRRAVRYVTAATGHRPQLVGGVLCWFGI